MKKITLILTTMMITLSLFSQTAWTLLVSGTTNHLLSASFINDTTGWIAGYSGTILKTTNGTTFTTETSGTTNDFYSISFINANKGFAVGNANTIVGTLDGGSTWTAVTCPVTGDLRVISFLTDSIGFITGGNIGGPPILLKTNDGGTTWSSITTSASQAIYGLYFTSLTTGYISDFNGNIFKTQNGGSSWTQQISPTTTDLHGMYFTDSLSGYVVGDNGTILSTSNGGTTWTSQTSGSSDYFPYVKFINGNTGFMVGGNISNNTSTILKTHDSGASWQVETSSSYRQYGASFPSANMGYTCGLNGTILKTTGIYLGSGGVNGFIYNDLNANCAYDSTDLGLLNIPIKIYDSIGTFRAITYSAANGGYHFYDTTGTYTIKVDTSSIAYAGQCNSQNTDTTLMLTSGTPTDNNVNFALTCKPGFDIGVQSIVVDGMIFPGWQYGFNVIAGDLSQWHNVHCASGVSGQVQITVAGPQTYDGIIPGSLTPTVAGNVFTYNITNFDSVNIFTAFGLLFHTDTSAQIGDTICMYVRVTPTVGDNDSTNNTYQYCYNVLNSLDPNYKTTYPQTVDAGYQDYFNYSIYFQNTGTAAAANIVVRDTLDNNLDWSTFQLMNYSNPITVNLVENNLAFSFHNINLPDSISNAMGSVGYVQYRIKPKTTVPAGTTIHNTGYVYFDYNAPVITNTTTNQYRDLLAINKNSTVSFDVYPNPGNGMYFIQLSNGTDMSDVSIKVYNLLGEMITFTKTKTIITQVDLTNEPNGIYFAEVKTTQGIVTKKIVVEK